MGAVCCGLTFSITERGLAYAARIYWIFNTNFKSKCHLFVCLFFITYVQNRLITSKQPNETRFYAAHIFAMAQNRSTELAGFDSAKCYTDLYVISRKKWGFQINACSLMFLRENDQIKSVFCLCNLTVVLQRQCAVWIDGYVVKDKY